VLACEAAGFGLFAWSVLTDDLEAVSERLSIEIHDYTIPHGDGTLRGWRTVSGPPHLPFFIDYPSKRRQERQVAGVVRPGRAHVFTDGLLPVDDQRLGERAARLARPSRSAFAVHRRAPGYP
jgi:hypothetical protein